MQKLGRWEYQVSGLGVRNLVSVLLRSEHLLDFQVELLSKQEEIEAWIRMFGLEVNIRES